jgi:hypothetical protein
MSTAAYLDPTRSLDERTDDLLARMTRAEKLAQLGAVWPRDVSEAGRRAAGRCCETCYMAHVSPFICYLSAGGGL